MNRNRIPRSGLHLLRAAAVMALILGSLGSWQRARAAAVLYVEEGATGVSCTGWGAANACDLQTALGLATSGDEAWVKTGVYVPGTSEGDSFNIPSGVAVYGGFAGGETSVSERDPQANLTILSGDIDNDDDSSNADGNFIDETAAEITGDNSDHVVTMDGGSTAVTTSTVLDGFIITAGDANGGGLDDQGGGLFCNSGGGTCSPTLSQLTFIGNQATLYGGALHNRGVGGDSSPMLSQINFIGNRSADSGGAVYNNGDGGISSPTLEGVSFVNNSSGVSGGAVYNQSINGVSSPTIINSTFSGNHATVNGGAIVNDATPSGVSSPVLTNLTFYNNSADGNGGAISSAGSGGTSAPDLHNVILWSDSAGNNGDEMYDQDASLSIDYSVVQDGESGIYDVPNNPYTDGVGNVDGNPRLGSLADNGGYTPTMALTAGSSALENALGGPTCPTTDQRGVARPQGAGCDRGAYERLPTPADFDLDYASDVVVFSGGAWQFYQFTSGLYTGGVWTGAPGGSCTTAPMDYDGDGATDFTLLCGDAWHFFNDNGSYNKGIWIGLPGALPVPADYDGDGTDDVVAFDGGAWQAYDFATGAYLPGSSVWTGLPGGAGIAVPMDYDGDGTADRTILSDSGSWNFYNGDGSYNRGIWTGGAPGDLPVPGHYSGSQLDQVVLFSGGAWQFFDFTTGAYLPASSVWTGAPAPDGSGVVGPAPLDYNGDGTLDFTYYAGGAWHFYNAGGGYTKGIWTGGVAGDVAISRRQLP